MKTALTKNTFREIKSSLGRFISIALMITLGCFTYVGLKSAGPDMRKTINELTKDVNMSHIVVQFSTGIEEKDKKKILEYKEISDSEFLKTIELKTEEDKLMNLIELPERISRPKVLEGRYPNKTGELLLDNELRSQFKIGDKIRFQKEEDETIFEIDKDKKDNKTENIINKNNKELKLAEYEFEIVGFCITPEYLGKLSKGRSFSRYGDFYSFAYMSKENFNILKNKDNKGNNKGNDSNKTQIAYLRFKDIDNMEFLDLGFDKKSLRHKEYLEKLFEGRSDELLNELNNNILNELILKEDELTDAKLKLKKSEDEIIKAKIKILEGWQEYEKGLDNYETEIKDAEEQLKDAKIKYEDGKKEYDKGKKDLDDAKAKYNKGLREYESGLQQYNDAKIELEDAETQLNLLKQNKNRLLVLKQLVQNEINAKKIIDRYNSLISQRAIKIQQRDEAIANGNTELAEQLQGEINNLNEQIESIGNIEEIRTQYNNIQAIKAGFDNYQRSIYQLEYTAISNNKPSYIQGLIDSIPQKEIEIEQGKETLRATKIVLDNTKSELDAAKRQIDQGEEELTSSKRELDQAKNKLDKAQKEFTTEKTKSLNIINDSKADLEDSEIKIKDIDEKFQSEKIKAEKEIEDAEKQINKVKEDIKRINKPLCLFSTRTDNTNYYLYYDSAHRINTLAGVFPPFLFLIALLVSLTTMTRMVDEQRQEIGTYKGLGYTNREIQLKFVVYGSIAAIIGGLIGIAVGSTIISEIAFKAYSTTFVLSKRLHVINYSSGIFAMVLALLCTSLAASMAVNRYLNINAAILMRPRVQKTGKKTMIEKVKFIWKRLPFLTKVTFRNVFRYKGRMFMTILGVGGCTGLLFFGFALRNSMAETPSKQKSDITRIDYLVSYNEIIGEEETKKFKNFVLEDDRIEKSTQIYFEPLIYKDTKGEIFNLSLICSSKDLKSFDEQIKLIDSRTDREKIKTISKNRKDLRKEEKNRLQVLRKQGKEDIIEFNNNSAIFTDKLLKLSGKERGEFIYIQDLYGKEYKIRVGKPAVNYISHFVYMSPKYFEEIFDKSSDSNAYIIKLKDNVDNEKFKSDLLEHRVITATIDMKFEEVDKWVAAIDIIVLVILLISGVLAFVVLYNLTYINISERVREISTIKVLGFYPKEVTKYIYSETAILTLIGIGVGYYFGHKLHQLIVDFIVPDILHLYRKIPFSIYFGATAITIVFFIVVGIIIHKKLNKIDMIEALKRYE